MKNDKLRFTILNDFPGIRNTVTAELVKDAEGDLRLRINGYLVLYINETGLLTLMREEVEPQTGGYRFQIAPHILKKDDDE